jgi:hypothetical protein
MSLHQFGGGRRLLAAALVALVLTLAAFALGRAPAPSAGPALVARPAEAPRLAGEVPARPTADPAGIRDVFRFADESPAVAYGEPAAVSAKGESAAADVPAGPHLAGLVRRAGRLMAALSVDGEVELAGPGDAAAGVTVLSVSEEEVRVRRADGTEQTLTLP